MTEPKDLIERNAVFAADGFVGDLTINPSGNMMVIGCVDPEVIKRNIHASAYLVTGLVYDVDTGLVETVVPPTLLSPA
jgi:carbonic anhydrase